MKKANMLILSICFLLSTPYGSYAQGGGDYFELDSLQLKSPRLFSPRAEAKGPKLFFKRAMSGITDDFRQLFNSLETSFKPVENIYDLESSGLTKSPKLDVGWNYFSFPTDIGGAAFRKNYLTLPSWQERHQSFLENTSEKLIQNSRISELSPIEKYEYLLGVKSFDLTKREWQTGIDLFSEYNLIPYWAGACHGTAPAVIGTSTPKQEITVRSSDGKREVTFTPKDLKILISYVWAENPAPYKMIGQRCRYASTHPLFSEVSSCFDTNPASFHLAITNIIGGAKRPLIIDTSSGNEVWNRPVFSYSYQYMRPDTRRTTRNLSIAMIDKEDYLNDPHSARRSPGTKSIVGIWMKVRVLNETSISRQSTSDTPRLRTLQFLYELEIDKDGKIIGGEWRDKRYPDFIWAPTPNKFPVTIHDRLYISNNSNEANSYTIPKNLNDSALRSHNNKNASFYLIDYLIQLSSQN